MLTFMVTLMTFLGIIEMYANMFRFLMYVCIFIDRASAQKTQYMENHNNRQKNK